MNLNMFWYTLFIHVDSTSILFRGGGGCSSITETLPGVGYREKSNHLRVTEEQRKNFEGNMGRGAKKQEQYWGTGKLRGTCTTLPPSEGLISSL